jgi:hypothetical protein
MILQFPDLDTLRLALASGVVPASVSLAPTAAGFDDRGQVWLQPSVAPARAVLAELRRLKVQNPRTSGVPVIEQLTSWLQIFPVERDPGRALPPEQAPVLFDLSAEQFSAVAAEILRLGNDRQSFRFFASKDGERVLLRVIAPPYYTLLRALDHDGAESAPVAYFECAPRLWIRVGHTHPFGPKIKVPEGKVLLLQPPRRWTFLPDAPFREIYEVLEFVLPSSRSAWSEGKVGRKLQVPLRLVPGDPSEVEELWVLRDRPLEQLDDLANNAGDDLLQRLSFAAASRDGQTVLVLRVRPSKGAPPAPVLDAVSFRTYLKLPNLFVPSGQRLHPPLSRHVIRKLLAEDPAVITWLYPNGDATFTPETLPDEAFRPLTDWIDYVLDHDREALQTWVQAAQFDFEAFVCADGEAPKSKKSPSGREKKAARLQAAAAEGEDVQAPVALPADTAVDAPMVVEEVPQVSSARPAVLQQQLTALEQRFLAMEGPLDSAERLGLWREMARLNAALGRGDDAGLCWLSAAWSGSGADPGWTWQWFAGEAAKVPVRDEPSWPKGRSWVRPATPGANQRREIDGMDLDRVLALTEPLGADLRALAAYVVAAADRQGPPPALRERLSRVRHFLEKHERLLPMRTAWLAATSLTRLTGGDILGLARTRDRLLERLYQTGLRPELELPAFLRFSGQPSSERFRAFQEWTVRLAELVQTWLQRAPREDSGNPIATGAYADLTFAFGLARLGEAAASQQLLQRAQPALEEQARRPHGEAHEFLARAYTYRIEQAHVDKPHQGPLPPELLRRLETFKADQTQGTTSPRYAADRLRQYSRILEPDQKVDAQQRYHAKLSPLEEQLHRLTDLADRKELVARLEELFRHAPTLEKDKSAPEAQARALRAALDVAPRVGEEFALKMLERLARVYEALPAPDGPQGPGIHAKLLEVGLFTAAHFDQTGQVQALVGRFQKLLESQKARPSAVDDINDLARQCFRGLRKLGLRDEIDLLLKQMADLVLAAQKVPTLQALLQTTFKDKDPAVDAPLTNWVAALRTLLHVASGWYYFGRDAEAGPVLDAVRTVLFQRTLLDRTNPHRRDQMYLACDYAATAARAPVADAQRRLEELFARLPLEEGWTTGYYYSLAKLRLIETTVMAIVADDFTVGGEVRRWLDEDEFLIRQRIHRDLREAMRRAET